MLKGVTETFQNEVKEQKEGFLSMSLGTLAASLLGNPLTGKGINRAGKGKGAIAASQGRGINRASEGVLRAGYRNKKGKKKTKTWIFNSASSFNKLWNTKILSKWTKI